MGEILIADDLSQIVKRAGGMLPLEVYQALFDAAGSGDGSDFIEIGTAHGASAIALCLGARAAGKTPRIITVDPLSGLFSSRARYGGPEENRAIVQRNFQASGTSGDIELFVGDSEALAGSGRLRTAADIVFLDSDGRIDRDLINLMPFLKDDALIIIDDVKPYAKLSIRSNGAPFVDLKHKISALLLERLVAMSWIVVEQVVGETAFCRRIHGHRWSVAALQEAALSCYRELVFTETSLAELTAWHGRAEAASRAAE